MPLRHHKLWLLTHTRERVKRPLAMRLAPPVTPNIFRDTHIARGSPAHFRIRRDPAHVREIRHNMRAHEGDSKRILVFGKRHHAYALGISGGAGVVGRGGGVIGRESCSSTTSRMTAATDSVLLCAIFSYDPIFSMSN